MEIAADITYVGVNDHQVDLFEGHYIVPNGMAYNSYVIADDKIAVMDSVDGNFADEWIANVKAALGERTPDYLVVQHMEPDHSASIVNFLEAFPSAQVVANAKAFAMLENFYSPELPAERKVEVKNGETLELGTHSLTFTFAPMVHWPEVMVSYDAAAKVLFSADAFGKFGALDVEEDWACEARRYYFGIVGPYGKQVQALLGKLGGLEVETICPLHGPILSEDLGYYLGLYSTWSSYEVETPGVFIAYTSVYGNTKAAVEELEEQLRAAGCPRVESSDLAREDIAEAVEDAFRHGTLVCATTTYNGDIFPYMREFIDALVLRKFQKRNVALVENGSWAPVAAKVMRGMFEECKDINFAENVVTINSGLKPETHEAIKALAEELAADFK